MGMWLLVSALSLLSFNVFADDIFDKYTPDEINQMMIDKYGPIQTFEDDSHFAGIEPMDIGKQIGASDIDVFKSFAAVIFINKADSGANKQTLKLYVGGKHWFTWPVSTGREAWETSKTGKYYFTGTPTGWYNPTWITTLHHSETWDADMPYSVFFNGGIAVHAAAPAYNYKLGTRASGGCVRVHYDNARYLYDLVSFFGKGQVPRFTRAGKAIRTTGGEIKMQQNWRVLVIVEDVVE